MKHFFGKSNKINIAELGLPLVSIIYINFFCIVFLFIACLEIFLGTFDVGYLTFQNTHHQKWVVLLNSLWLMCPNDIYIIFQATWFSSFLLGKLKKRSSGKYIELRKIVGNISNSIPNTRFFTFFFIKNMVWY